MMFLGLFIPATLIPKFPDLKYSYTPNDYLPEVTCPVDSHDERAEGPDLNKIEQASPAT
jgi:hypothetical protein